MKRITCIWPYYENPHMLQRQQETWLDWPDWVKDRTEIIIVDDCSSEYPATHQIWPRVIDELNFKLFCITEKVRWNWIAAKNIGAHQAGGDWLMLTDIDHVVDKNLIVYLHEFAAHPECFYVPSRVDGSERRYNPKPHPNSYFMTKEFFWKVGGYNEYYSGHYGSDGTWRRRCETTGKKVLLNVPLVQYLPNEIEDCCSKLERKSEEQRLNTAKITQWIEANGNPVKTLSFPYERLL